MQEIPKVQQPPQVPQQPMYQQQPPMYPPPTSYGQLPQGYGQQPSPYPPQQPYVQWSQQPYGQYPPPPPKKKRRILRYCLFTSAIILGIFVLLIVIGAIIGNNGSNTPSSSTLSELDFKALSIDTTVATLDKDGNQDKNMNIHFTATILNLVKNSNGNTGGANVDSPATSGVVQVIFPAGIDLNKINTGDTLEVWGTDEGTFSGQNLFGANIQEVGIQAAYMTDQTTGYQTA